jgi:hypothetical protein
MDLTSGRVWLVLGALSLVACSPRAPSPQEESSVLALSSQTISVSMSLPSGLTSAGLLVGQTNVQLDSNIVVPGPVWSGGSLFMQPDVKVQAAS